MGEVGGGDVTAVSVLDAKREDGLFSLLRGDSLQVDGQRKTSMSVKVTLTLNKRSSVCARHDLLTSESAETLWPKFG